MSKKQTDNQGLEFSIVRDILRDAVRLVSASVSTRSAWNQSQYVGNLLIVADDDGLELRTAGIEASVSLRVQGALVTETGKCVVPLKLLADLLQTFPSGGRVDVGSDGEGTVVVCGRSESTLVANVEPDAFPPAIGFGDDEGISLQREALIEVAGQVVVAASTDDSRPALSGVCFDFSSAGLTLVAADGFRLAVRSLPLETKSEREESIVIPASSLGRLLKVLRRLDDETVLLYILNEGRRVVFQTENFQMATQTIAHPFPKWEQIVPESYKASVTVDNMALNLALKQARLFPRAEREVPHVKMAFLNSGKDLLRIRTVNGVEVGDYTGDLPVVCAENEPVTFGVNARFLLEMLPKLGKTVQIKTNEASDPVALMNGELTYVVMPITLRQ